MNQLMTPLFTALQKSRGTFSYHVPGHKNGSVYLEDTQEIFQQIMEIDKTEIAGLDDLHDPNSVIQEAQELLADLYGTEKSYFLVGGSTSGNIAMLLASVSRGDTVLVQRNSHQSVFYGLELAGAHPVFLDPDRDEGTGLALGIAAETLDAAFRNYPHAKAVLLTNPTYEGFGQLLTAHKRICDEYNALLLVDEAHGAHLLPLNEEAFPPSALAAGADLVVQSAHKTLPALTMAAWLHRGTLRVSDKKMQKALAMVQSSSPSYPLMASLDIARAYAAQKNDWHRLSETIAAGRKKLQTKVAMLPEKIGNYRLDPLKISLLAGNQPEKTGLWQETMEQNGAYPELRSPAHLLLILSLNTDITKKMLDRLISFFSAEKPEQLTHKVRKGSLQAVPMAASFEEINTKTWIEVPWKNAAGEIAAEAVIPYPPGIPLLIPGEQITEAHIQQYFYLRKQHVRVKGGGNKISILSREG